MSDFNFKEYDELLNENFPEQEKIEPTIFDISGYPHYENVISNWYAFFLDEKNPHGLDSLFYTSLHQLVGQDRSFRNTTVIEREYLTNEGNRIDLLVHDGNDKGYFTKPIIIECKIYADLYNKLNDYYDSIKVSSDNDKKGLILSLHANEKPDHKQFCVRSHQQYMDMINKNLPEYIENVNIKYFTLLQDLMRNIKKLTRGSVMNESSKYYFSHAEKIDELLGIRSEANSIVIDKIYAFAARNGMKWGRSSAKDGSFNFMVNKSGAWYYIGLKGLKFTIEVWVPDEVSEETKTSIDDFLNSKKSGNKREFNKKKVLTYREYDIEEENVEKYDESIIDAVNKIEEFLGNNAPK